MKKAQGSLSELFEKLQQADKLSIELEYYLKDLKKRKLIKKETLKQLAEILDGVLNEAWQSFGRRASRSGFPVLIREDQVQKRFKISQATLYRRRKTQEIPYVRDNEGVIWYPVVDLVEYYLKSRSEIRLPKTGRPRKF
jgi:hypothetical protein